MNLLELPAHVERKSQVSHPLREPAPNLLGKVKPCGWRRHGTGRFANNGLVTTRSDRDFFVSLDLAVWYGRRFHERVDRRAQPLIGIPICASVPSSRSFSIISPSRSPWPKMFARRSAIFGPADQRSQVSALKRRARKTSTWPCKCRSATDFLRRCECHSSRPSYQTPRWDTRALLQTSKLVAAEQGFRKSAKTRSSAIRSIVRTSSREALGLFQWACAISSLGKL